MIVVQAPVAQKVDNSQRISRCPVDKIYRFISVVESLDSADPASCSAAIQRS